MKDSEQTKRDRKTGSLKTSASSSTNSSTHSSRKSTPRRASGKINPKASVGLRSVRSRDIPAQAVSNHPAKKLITIHVVTLMGKSITVTVFPTSTIGDLKNRLYDLEGICTETQLLVFRDQELNNDTATVGKLGLQDGSTVKLLIRMTGGPGIPLKTKTKLAEEDSVLLLLCRQNDELFMLEVHMKDGQNREDAANQLLRLTEGAQLSSANLIEFDGLESMEMMDMNGSGDEIEEIIEGMDPGNPSRPTSTYSTLSTSTFVSFVATSARSSPRQGSRPKSDKKSSRSTSSLSNSSSLLEFLNESSDYWIRSQLDPTQLTTKTSSLPCSPATTQISGKLKTRPATAISIMRLPITNPMILLPKSRPASAVIQQGHILSVLSHSLQKLGRSPSLESVKAPVNRDSRSESKESSRSKKSLSTKSVRFNDVPSVSHSIEYDLPISDPLLEFESLVTEEKSPRLPLKRTVVQRPSCCELCRKKLSLTGGFKCKCQKTFCATHRYSDRHGCTFDYKMAGKMSLIKENPMVKKDKVLKI